MSDGNLIPFTNTDIDAIENIVANQIMEWFNRKVKTTDISPLYAAIKKEDTVAIEEFIRSLLSKNISSFDSMRAFIMVFPISPLWDARL